MALLSRRQIDTVSGQPVYAEYHAENYRNGNVVRTPDGLVRYEITDVERSMGRNIDNNTFETLDLENMQKEELDCHPTLWNIL